MPRGRPDILQRVNSKELMHGAQGHNSSGSHGDGTVFDYICLTRSKEWRAPPVYH
jgi:hypothetical protein